MNCLKHLECNNQQKYKYSRKYYIVHRTHATKIFCSLHDSYANPLGFLSKYYYNSETLDIQINLPCSISSVLFLTYCALCTTL